MPKRFLNVKYENYAESINVTDMENLSEVKDAIKLKWANNLAKVDSPSIQLWKGSAPEDIIEDLDDIAIEYFKKKRDGGLYLTVKLAPR
jgi:hypothetical protein